MTNERLAPTIVDLVAQARGRYEQLVLVVGVAGSGKTSALLEVERQTGYPYRSIGVEVSRHLLDVPSRRRPLEVGKVVERVVAEAAGDAVLLDNLEVLFDPSLKLNPLNLLRRISRNRRVVAAWTGYSESGNLIYAAPSHREYRRYPIESTIIVHPPAA